MKIKRSELNNMMEVLDTVIDNYEDAVEYGKYYKEAQETARKALELIEHLYYGSVGNKNVMIEVVADENI